MGGDDGDAIRRRLASSAAAVTPRCARRTAGCSSSFAILTYGGLRAGRDTEERLQQQKSPLWPAYYAGQEVITAVRLASERRRARSYHAVWPASRTTQDASTWSSSRKPD